MSASESGHLRRNWQQAFWSQNYGRLTVAKRRYDPDGLLVARSATCRRRRDHRRFPREQASISNDRRLFRVASCLALTTHQVTFIL